MRMTRRSWLRPGAHLAVKDMPTYFGGKVNLTADVAADGGSVQVSLKLAKLAVEPANIAIRLRSGDGAPLAYAVVDGKRVPAPRGDVIRLPVVRDGKWKIVGVFGK